MLDFERIGHDSPIVVTADWDPEARMWVATSREFRGLVTEAESVKALRAKLRGMILDLLEEATANETLKEAGLPKAF